MALAFNGSRTRSLGKLSAIIKQVKLANLKPLRQITVSFNPFQDQVEETRNFIYYISRPKTLYTNPLCRVKTVIDCNQDSEPLIVCNFENNDKLTIKGRNLNTVDLLKVFNKHVTSRVPKEEPQEILLTKSQKKKLK